jgi:hypothetical protein
MHTKSIIVVFLAAVFACLEAGPVSAEDGLVAHFNFDEGSGTVVRDSSGFGNDGTINGATYVEVGQGYALQFDGHDDHVEIPDASHLKLSGNLSVAVWVNPAVNSTGGMVSKNGCSSLRQNYVFALQEGGVEFKVTKCPELGQPVASRSIDKDVWHQLVGTFNGKDLKIYINGAWAATHHYEPFDAGTLASPLYIGATFYGARLGGHFAGQIDDVRIFNSTLTASEITAGYEAEKNERISKLTAMMDQVSAFDEIDTTPPALHLPSPPPDSTVSGDVTIAAAFADKGSGVDGSSARIKVDGQDLTAKAEITTTGFSLSPPVALGKGIHHVEVTVADEAGNLGNRLKWRFGVDQAVPVKVKFEDGVFLVNNEPYFPIGLYGGNAKPTLPYFAQAAAAGVNYRLEGESLGKEKLDWFLMHNVKALKHLYRSSLALEKGDSAPLEAVLATKNHPAMLGWWNEHSSSTKIDLAIQVRDFVKQRDPNHPVVYMLGWAGEISDVHCVYAYPILNPLLPNDDIMSMYDGTIKSAVEAAEAEGKGKQVWFVSQAFDYRIDSNRGKIVTLEGGFRPSREELRAMNYLALAKGVKGLCYYAPGAEIPDTPYSDNVAIYPRQWTELLKTASEIRHLTPTLAAGAVGTLATLANDNPAIHFRQWSHRGVHTLIAVNVERSLSLAVWNFQSAVQPQVLFEDRQSAGPSTSLTDLFHPLQVHVYQW